MLVYILLNSHTVPNTHHHYSASVAHLEISDDTKLTRYINVEKCDPSISNTISIVQTPFQRGRQIEENKVNQKREQLKQLLFTKKSKKRKRKS